MVALLEALRARADRGDDAGALVAADQRELADRAVAGGDVVVGVAQARGGQLDLELTGLRVVDAELHDLPLAGHGAHDRAPGLHGIYLLVALDVGGRSGSAAAARVARYGARHTVEEACNVRGAAADACNVAAAAASTNTGAVPGDPVVVVGAGPVGLTAALLLARRGLSVLRRWSATGRPIPCPGRCTWTTRCSACCRRPASPTSVARADPPDGRPAAARRPAPGAGRVPPRPRDAGLNGWPQGSLRPPARPGGGAGRGRRPPTPGSPCERGAEVTGAGPGRRRRDAHRRDRGRRCGPVRPGGRGPRLRRRQQHRARR